MAIQRPKPIVDQIAAVLRERLNDRTYPPGSRMPSESELALELGVSRTTVRTVLAKFAAEGLIIRKQGDGTYISERLADVDPQYGGMRDFSDLIEANGYRPTIKMLSLTTRPARVDEAAQLEIAPGSAVVAMARLFGADGRPVIHATNVFPRALVKVDNEALQGNLRLHEILRTYCQESIAYVISDIEATLVDETVAKTLRRVVGQPILAIRETFYNKDHRPLILGISNYDFARLKLRLVHAWE